MAGYYKRTIKHRKRHSEICKKGGTGKWKRTPIHKQTMSRATKGRKFSLKHRENLSLALKKRWKKGGFKHLKKRKKRTEAQKQKIKDFWKNLTEEEKEIRRKKAISNLPKNVKLENNPNWKGGITPKNEIIRKSLKTRLWRETVFKRDNWTCQKYRIKSGKLHSHHILNFSKHPKLRFAIDNGITLSKRAHEEFHAIYGRTNNTKKQLEKYLTTNIYNLWRKIALIKLKKIWKKQIRSRRM